MTDRSDVLPSSDDFHEFVVGRQRALIGFAYLLTTDYHAAEDLVQTALAKAFLRWDRIRARGSAEVYVRKIVVNENITIWRRAWKRNEHSTDELPDRGVTDPDNTERGAMWANISTLPPRQRTVLVLRYYEDMTEAHTAAVMGCSVGTVKSQAFKGLGSLRNRMTDIEQTGDHS